jgi:c-di-GMP-binding flagellar brake protein YcgR
MAHTIDTFSMDAGTKLLMDVNGLGVKVYSYFVGMVRGRFIMTQIPFAPDQNREHIFQFLYPQNRVTVRYIQEGSALGFHCEIMKYIMVPYPLMFLSYPGKIETYELRKHKRLNCLFQSTAIIGDQPFRSMITDLSTGGCQLIIPGKENPPTCAVDDLIRLKCASLLSENGSTIEGRVMRFQKNEHKCLVGLKFQPLAPAVSAQIEDFVTDAQLCLM